MAFNRIRPPGLWIDQSVVSPLEFETIDNNISLAVDGRGGTYALEQDLVIGGTATTQVTIGRPIFMLDTVALSNGVTVSGQVLLLDNVIIGLTSVDVLAVNSTTTFTNDVTIGSSGTDDFVVNADAQFNGGVFFADAVVFLDPVYFNDNVQFLADITGKGAVFVDAVTMEDECTIDGTLAATANCFLGAPSHVVELLAPTTIWEPVSFQGNGKIRWRSVLGTDAHSSFAPATVDSVIVPPGALSAARNYTINDAGASNGMRIRFINNDETHIVYIKHPGGASLDLIGGSFAGEPGERTWAEFERVSGTWTRVAMGKATA